MVYGGELGNGQQIYLSNQGDQTTITLVRSGIGQQQQASSSFHTGAWVAPPVILRTPQGFRVRLQTAMGEQYVVIQGDRMGMSASAFTSGTAEMLPLQPLEVSESVGINPMEPMPSLEPMPPLKMGNMQMRMNPMEMKMGNMAMKMGPPLSQAATVKGTPQFCSQCGARVKSSDRFCCHCGHELGT